VTPKVILPKSLGGKEEAMPDSDSTWIRCLMQQPPLQKCDNNSSIS
jgi:hypothetical protein